MSTTKVTINSLKGTSTLVRARFGPGMLLQHEDLEQLNAYTRELSRLLFRSLFGCGVVCGLVVETEGKCGKVIVTVSAGLALDCSGDPVHLPRAQSLSIDEDCDPNLPSSLWVILCGNSKCCAPRASTCAPDDDEAPSVCTRERDGFEIRIVRELPKCVCGCREGYEVEVGETECGCVNPEHPCYRGHYAGKCGCPGGEDSDCSCECILLARLKKPDGNDQQWTVDHRVRRFVRPVLMRDPLAVRAGTSAMAAPAADKEQPAKSSSTAKAKRRG